MKMKSIVKIVFALTLLCVGSYALADGSLGFPSSGLSPSHNDQSRYYLGLIFGKVGNVLSGQGSQILGAMFGEFNRAILILGTIIFTYVYGKGVLDTAAHGEFLGKQANSLWVPLRSVGGLALMIPKASTGYCVIQIFLMWVVLQGVGAADMLWSTLSSNLKTSSAGSASNSSAVISGAIASQLTSQVNHVFSGLVCAYSVQKSLNSGAVVLDYAAKGDSRSYNIGYSSAPGAKAVNCGTVSWNLACKAGDKDCAITEAQQKKAVENIITNLQPIAQFYVNDAYRFCTKRDGTTGQCTAPAFPEGMSGAGNYKEVAKHVYHFSGKVDFPQNESEKYVDALASDKAGHNHSDPSKSVNTMTDDGWIYAGSFIYQLAKSVNNSGSVPNFRASVVPFSDVRDNFPKDSYPNDPIERSASYASKLPSDQADPGSQSNGDGDPRKKLLASFETMTSVVAAGGVAATGVSIASGVAPLAVVSGAFTGIVVSYGTIIGLIIDGKSPGPLGVILYLQTFGYIVLAVLGLTFGFMLIALFTTSLGTNVMNCMQPVGFAAGETLSYVSYLVMAAFAGMLAIGVFLAVYLPLLPFIYFTFGVLSWLVAVFETMVAAPIVALGVIHPEGHDFWGKAEPAVMLTVNVFLRPSLMLFGLVAAILVGYVFVDIITIGFGQALFNMQDKGSGMGNPIEAICVMGLYTFLIVVGYSQCFKLITETGNRVLSWLGFQGQLGLQTDDALGQMKQNSSAISGAAQSGFRDVDAKIRDKVESKKRKLSQGNGTGMSGSGGNLHVGSESSSGSSSPSGFDYERGMRT